MLNVHRAALWQVMQEPGGIPKYYRIASGGYNLRRVMEPEGRRLVKRWALYHGPSRVWEIQAMSDRDAAMAQAEAWLREQEIVS